MERQRADESYIEEVFIAHEQNQAREEAAIKAEEDEDDTSSIKVNVDDTEDME
jgi:hypothetical protein